jgi:2-methylcitrate dehydratase PrpD
MVADARVSEEAAARRLARFVLDLRLAALPGAVVEQAQRLVLDILGSCLASSTMDFGEAAIRVAQALGGPPVSSVIGTATRVAPANAVLANGTLAHGLDFDDTREDAIVHTGCAAVTSALAVAEATSATGAALLEATVAAVEVMCRVGLTVPGRFHARHFHPTSLTAGFAAAAAAGRLLGLSEDELTRAFGICGSQAGGIIEYLGDGSWTKRLHPGWTGHGGVIAAQLAQAGFTGPERVLEGEHGFFAAFAGGHDAGRLVAQLDSLGRVWEILELTYKPYPCGSIAHPYMDCALRLRERHGVRPADVAAIECETAAGPVPRLWEPLAAKHRPPNGYAAKFSLPYLLAVIIAKGRAGFAEFTDAACRDEAVLALAARVRYTIDPSIDYPRQFVGRVRVTLADGRVLEERQDRPRGGPDLPMTRDDLVRKFRGNAELRLPADAVERVIERVGALARAPGLGPLAEALAPR